MFPASFSLWFIFDWSFQQTTNWTNLILQISLSKSCIRPEDWKMILHVICPLVMRTFSRKNSTRFYVLPWKNLVVKSAKCKLHEESSIIFSGRVWILPILVLVPLWYSGSIQTSPAPVPLHTLTHPLTSSHFHNFWSHPRSSFAFCKKVRDQTRIKLPWWQRSKRSTVELVYKMHLSIVVPEGVISSDFFIENIFSDDKFALWDVMRYMNFANRYFRIHKSFERPDPIYWGAYFTISHKSLTEIMGWILHD